MTLNCRYNTSKITSSKQCLRLRCCCIFGKNELEVLPYFSQKEALGLKKKLIKRGKNLYQAKYIKSKFKKRSYACIFLKENDHTCKIYSRRPLECKMWPFIFGKDKNNKGLYLWIANKNVCPATKKLTIKEIKIIGRKMLKTLKKNGVFLEIKESKRYIWPYFNYHKKVISLNNFVK